MEALLVRMHRRIKADEELSRRIIADEVYSKDQTEEEYSKDQSWWRVSRRIKADEDDSRIQEEAIKSRDDRRINGVNVLPSQRRG